MKQSQLPYFSPLLTDFYQLTMAKAYWASGKQNLEAIFHLTFRENPFRGGFAVAAGLGTVIEYLKNYRFCEDDLSFLSHYKDGDGQPLFSKDFLTYLEGLTITCDIEAVPEGTVVFPYEPILRVRGPIIQAQLLETALLNIINFQTLIATKAARIGLAAQGDPIIEFGCRRAQGFDGAVSATRAAFIGGCESTSNVAAARLYGIPARGTHAHSWVMAHHTEAEAFRAFGKVMPHNSIFLVDTYNTLEGVRAAIQIHEELRAYHHKLLGIRLDSGDLAWLSREARRLLDKAGLYDTKIIASHDLDEYVINSIKQEGCDIDVWGVGTRLVTAYDQPALGGVYKLAALREPGKDWVYKIKLSEQMTKTSIPGIHQIRRFVDKDEFIGDMIYDRSVSPEPGYLIIHPLDITQRKRFSLSADYFDLLVPIMTKGQLVYEEPTLAAIKDGAKKQIEKLNPSIKRFMNPHVYPVGLELKLFEIRENLILQARGFTGP